MTLAAGSRLGPYEITAKLGEGGMGEVFQATDTRLRREVAIKVLPAAFTADPERLARFEREAQLLAQLQHPNIASIYGLEESDGERALVMELVPGPTLAERLQAGPLPVEEALSVALQIARALEEAHEKGIVHRDLKPQNIKITADERVKVLDFGLAKAMDAGRAGSSAVDAARSPTLMNSPTLTAMQGTQLGVILGTASYMSPEQAAGKVVDRRSDIWAFGVVLWEMLSGRKLFDAESVPETLGAVFRQPIDFAALPEKTPPAVRRLVERCLDRDPKARLRDIGEARIALERSVSGEEPLATPAPGRTEPTLVRRLLPWLAGAAAGALIAWLALGRLAPVAVTTAAKRSPVLAIRLPSGLSIPLEDRGIFTQNQVLAISPDGARIAFLEISDGRGVLRLRDLDSAETRVVEGTAGATTPFFSPDGRWLGFFVSGKLRKVPIDGGRPVDVADGTLDRGAAWCPDGSIVFSPAATAGLLRVPPDGGAAQELTRLDEAKGERTHRWPALLPGGREVAFTIGVVGRPGDYEDSAIDAVELATGKRRPLFRGASMARFTPDGTALLGREGQVLAMPLDGSGAGHQSTENARLVLDGVAGLPASGVVYFDVSNEGTLVYAARDLKAAERELVWATSAGEVTPLALPRGEYSQPKVAPDGRRIALSVGPGGGRGGDVWIHDLATNALNRFTFDGQSVGAIWARDGRHVTYMASLPDGREVFRQRLADGSESPVTIHEFANGSARSPVAWMADGSLLFWMDGGPGAAGDLYFLPPGGGEAKPFVSGPAVEAQAAASPDGRYVAYYGDDAETAIYVQPFPPTGAKWHIAENAAVPIWSADGRELYFLQGEEVMVAPVSTEGAFSFGAPRKLFTKPRLAITASDTITNYAVAADGRFLFVRNTSREFMGDHLVVILNWFERLKRSAAGARP